MSHSALVARISVAATLAAALCAATPALATVYVPPPDLEQTAADPLHCAKLELIFARGANEPAGKPSAFDGYYYGGGADSDRDPSTPYDNDPVTPGDQTSPAFPTGEQWSETYTDRNAPWGVWTSVARELTAPPAPRTPEYVPSDLHRYDVNYPASVTEPDFTYSAMLGYIDVTRRLNEENVRCPSKKFMLFGYSQGALVIGNVISRADRRQFWNTSVPGREILMTAAAKAKIVAIGLFGHAGFRGQDWVKFSGSSSGPLDPTATRNWWEPLFEYEYDRVVRGTVRSTAPGLFNGSYVDRNGRRNDGDYANDQHGITPRVLQSYYPELALKVRDYCVSNDVVCSGQGDLNGHGEYQRDLSIRQRMAIFAIQKLHCPTAPNDPACAGGEFPSDSARFPSLRIWGPVEGG